MPRFRMLTQFEATGERTYEGEFETEEEFREACETGKLESIDHSWQVDKEEFEEADVEVIG